MKAAPAREPPRQGIIAISHHSKEAGAFWPHQGVRSNPIVCLTTTAHPGLFKHSVPSDSAERAVHLKFSQINAARKFLIRLYLGVLPIPQVQCTARRSAPIGPEVSFF